MYAPLDTYQGPWTLLRAEADEDATALDLTTKGDFANKPSLAKEIRTKPDGTGSGANGVEIVFCGGAAENKTFTYKIYAWLATNGMAWLVATGAGTLGTQAVVKYPNSCLVATSKFLADTLTVTDTWISGVGSSDTTGGSGGVASLLLNLAGYKWLYAEISDADGATGTQAGDVSAYYAFY